MDIVYLCRPGENEELRYSLRSLRNLPHGRVWIFGGAPDWVRNVTVVPVRQDEFTFRNAHIVKYTNVRRSLTAAVQHSLVSEHFTYMNDDFYVTEEITEVPVLNYGTREEFDRYYLAKTKIASNYVEAEHATLDWLRDEYGVPVPLSYALHVPLPVCKGLMDQTLQVLPAMVSEGQPAHLRTAYGNIAQIGGETIRDVKVERGTRGPIRRINGVRIGSTEPKPELPKPFASSSDRSFISDQFPIGKWIRAMFPDPGPYEA